MKRNRDILSFFRDREVKAKNISSSSSPAEGVQGVEETQEGRGGTQASGNQLISSQTENIDAAIDVVVAVNHQPQPQPRSAGASNTLLGLEENIYDVELFPHDPGKRTPITSYDVNDQDAVRRGYIMKGPCQPYTHVIVKRTKEDKRLYKDSWRDLTRAFASGRSLFSFSGHLQRSLAETLACAASCIKDPEASVQYLRDLMGPVAGCLVENASRSDLKSVAQQADVVYMVCCLLERLRGAARATQPRTQNVLFEMGHTVMNSLLTLLEVYKNQSAVIYMILKFVVDLADGQAVFLDIVIKSLD